MFNKSLFKYFILLLLMGLVLRFRARASAQEGSQTSEHFVQPGDSWAALSWRYNLSEEVLRSLNSGPNQGRWPSIGTNLTVPINELPERTGRLRRSNDGGLLQSAMLLGTGVWELALVNHLEHPYTPQFFRPVFSPDPATIPRDLPLNFSELELSSNPGVPGRALAFRGSLIKPKTINVEIGNVPMSVFQEGYDVIALGGTGAFYRPGDYELVIKQQDDPLWSQPWHLGSGSWTFEEIYLTGDAAAIDQESIRLERERLEFIWSMRSDEPLWTGPFQLPLQNYLAFSSLYGARRSYNGGPYRSYHEGLDFSAYGGTPVYAPADGRVVLAEFLDVRGGAVIIDHGLGLYSGFYHMSEILIPPGESVTKNQEIGKVGSTGLSTGNHLHWDLLINNTWIDPGDWVNSNLACWLSEGYGQPCQ